MGVRDVVIHVNILRVHDYHLTFKSYVASQRISWSKAHYSYKYNVFLRAFMTVHEDHKIILGHC